MNCELYTEQDLRVKAFCDEEGRVYERVRRVSWWTGRVVEEWWLLVGH